jgi:hypothetical protein
MDMQDRNHTILTTDILADDVIHRRSMLKCMAWADKPGRLTSLVGEFFLKRTWIFALVIACPAMALGQVSKATRSGTPTSQTTATTPLTAGYGDGGYGYGGAAQTAESAALQGLSQVISAEGQYNLATSKATVNMTEAESDWLRDNVQWRQTLGQSRDIGREERERELGPRPTPEELARRARAGAPRSLTTGQIDPVSGVLHWPAALQVASFEAQRSAVDEYTAKWVRYGGLDYDTQSQVRENIGTMLDVLKSQIASIPPQDYVACRKFLQSLLYATTRTTFKRPGFETASSDVREAGWLTKGENNNGRVQSR